MSDIFDEAIDDETPFASIFDWGSGEDDPEGAYIADRIGNNALNGSGPNDPSLASQVATTLGGFLFSKPKGSATPAAIAGSQVKTGTSPVVWVILGIIIYLIVRR